MQQNYFMEYKKQVNQEENNNVTLIVIGFNVLEPDVGAARRREELPNVADAADGQLETVVCA